MNIDDMYDQSSFSDSTTEKQSSIPPDVLEAIKDAANMIAETVLKHGQDMFDEEGSEGYYAHIAESFKGYLTDKFGEKVAGSIVKETYATTNPGKMQSIDTSAMQVNTEPATYADKVTLAATMTMHMRQIEDIIPILTGEAGKLQDLVIGQRNLEELPQLYLTMYVLQLMYKIARDMHIALEKL